MEGAGINWEPRDFEAWGTGIEGSFEAMVLLDNPMSVLDRVREAGADELLEFTAAAGYIDNQNYDDDKFMPRRPVWLRVKDIHAIDPLTPRYVESHEKGNA